LEEAGLILLFLRDILSRNSSREVMAPFLISSLLTWVNDYGIGVQISSKIKRNTYYPLNDDDIILMLNLKLENEEIDEYLDNKMQRLLLD
jgi:hypothetical protein